MYMISVFRIVINIATLQLLVGILQLDEIHSSETFFVSRWKLLFYQDFLIGEKFFTLKLTNAPSQAQLQQ